MVRQRPDHRGGGWFKGGAFATALEIWQSVEGPPELDALGTVRVTHNIALCLAELGRASETIDMARMTIAEFETSATPPERTRSRMVLGRALLATGHPEEVPTICREIIAEFTKAGLQNAAVQALGLLQEALVVGEVSASVRRTRSRAGQPRSDRPRRRQGELRMLRCKGS